MSERPSSLNQQAMSQPARFPGRIFATPRHEQLKYTPLASHDSQSPETQMSFNSALPRTKSTRWSLIYVLCFVPLLCALSLCLVLAIRNADKAAPGYPPLEPLMINYDTVHPISYLVELANAQFSSLQSRQSRTLTMAVDEYQRRYSIAPPPHFDRWYEFATQRGTKLIDEFDEIASSLNLFWGMEPQLIRRRAREILGHDNSLMGASIRKGQVRIIGDGQDEFQAVATQEMLSKFSEWLPDMDLAFNVNDEPRVLVPHEDVGRLLSVAALSKNSVRATKNAFSEPHDLEDETSFESASDSPFNRLDHQQTFTHARMSCPPSSPARSLGLNPEEAELGLKVGGLTFVENITTFSDICLAPSVRKVIGLFNKPNVLSISHDLLPVFSPSKLSTFHDILYPSPYYYAGKTKYDISDSVQWNKKAPKLYWRGATSGGYSEGGTWHSLLRQSILAKLRPDGETRILVHENTDLDGSVPRWKAQLISRETVAHRYDTKFTEIKQCAPEDCAEMRDFFGSNAQAPQKEAWTSRYLLDMDGNALSARFYALLESLSLPLKVAYYREWHMSRIIPWKHFVPLTATMDEYDEILRFFEEEDDGRRTAERLAIEGHEWVKNVARKEDMEVYMFRLLLEYARVIDDDRLHLGFEQ